MRTVANSPLVSRIRGPGFSVHEPVDDLCKTAPALCAGGVKAGDSAAGSPR